MTDESPWDAIDGVSNRQPAYCPYCGHNGSFDGQGPYHDGYKCHCTQCGLSFVTFTPEEVETDE